MDNNELQSRRDFFKCSAKKVLPVVGVIAVSQLPILSHAHEANAEMGCYNGCSGSCYGDCRGSCSTNCDRSCTGSCKGGCQQSCDGHCIGNCYGSCRGDSDKYSWAAGRTIFRNHDSRTWRATVTDDASGSGIVDFIKTVYLK